MNDCLITYIKKKKINSIDDEKIIQHFRNMRSRRGEIFTIILYEF